VSDLQDLIHKNAHNAYEIGVKTERQRIIELLDSLDIQFTDLDDPDYIVGDALDLIELIKGEQE
jgi:hypothetical protein